MCQANNGGGWWLTRTGFDPLKTFLSFLLACFSVSAATPSFSSFNTNQFSTNSLIVSLRDPLVISSLSVSNVTYNNAQSIIGVQPFLIGGTYTNILATNLLSGNNDIYTVPVGSRMAVWNMITGTTNQTTTQYYFLLKTNGITYKIFNDNNAITNSVGFSTPHFIFEENETFVLNAANAGLNFLLTGVLIGQTNTPKGFRFTNFSVGDNVVYEVPTGKRFYPATIALTATSTIWNYSNTSGGPVVVTFYLVPPGNTVNPGTKFRQSTVANNTVFPFALPPVPEGFKVVLNVNVNTAGQMVWVVGMEQ